MIRGNELYCCLYYLAKLPACKKPQILYEILVLILRLYALILLYQSEHAHFILFYVSPQLRHDINF